MELGDKNGLSQSYAAQGLILQDWGPAGGGFCAGEESGALCLELGNKDGLQCNYGYQALILQDWGRLEEALELLKKEEVLCLELGNRSGLAYCYWKWSLLAHEQRDRKMQREKLAAALEIFTELNMAREREAVRAELEKTTAADRAT
jgi:hypothetical protein